MRYLRLLATLSLISAFSDVSLGDSVWEVTNPNNGNLYRLVNVDSPLTWGQSADYAANNWGGHLVSIHDQFENDFVQSLITANSPFLSDTWIGLSDEQTEGVWEWTSGESFSYSNWIPGQPNGSGDYVLMKADTGLWNDVGNQPLSWLVIENQQSADFNSDGVVDGLDFLKWQAGESPNSFSESDLQVWEIQYGASVPISATTAAVPEPTTILLAWMGLLIATRRCR